MRAREAEDLMAAMLVKSGKEPAPQNSISEVTLLGINRSRPLYKNKIQQRQKASKVRFNSTAKYYWNSLLNIFKN